MSKFKVIKEKYIDWQDQPRLFPGYYIHRNIGELSIEKKEEQYILNLSEENINITYVVNLQNKKMCFHSTGITKINKIPNDLLYICIHSNNIQKIENLPNNLEVLKLTEGIYDTSSIKWIDNIPIDWFREREIRFDLKWYNGIKKFQRFYKIILKNRAAIKIQRGCHDFLWSPYYRSPKGKVGGLMFLKGMRACEEINSKI